MQRRPVACASKDSGNRPMTARGFRDCGPQEQSSRRLCCSIKTRSSLGPRRGAAPDFTLHRPSPVARKAGAPQAGMVIGRGRRCSATITSSQAPVNGVDGRRQRRLMNPASSIRRSSGEFPRAAQSRRSCRLSVRLASNAPRAFVAQPANFDCGSMGKREHSCNRRRSRLGARTAKSAAHPRSTLELNNVGTPTLAIRGERVVRTVHCQISV
jgi:hypothetical protein